MKTIEFGFDNNMEPTGSWQGMGIKEGLLLVDAQYIGSVEVDEQHFVIAKVEKDEYNRFPDLAGKFIVRDALVDVYADGSTTLFLNQQQSAWAKQIENLINLPQVNAKIHNIEDVFNAVNGIHRSNNAFKIEEMKDKLIATSIVPEAYERKYEAINHCHRPISEVYLDTLEDSKHL